MIDRRGNHDSVNLLGNLTTSNAATTK